MSHFYKILDSNFKEVFVNPSKNSCSVDLFSNIFVVKKSVIEQILVDNNVSQSFSKIRNSTNIRLVEKNASNSFSSTSLYKNKFRSKFILRRNINFSPYKNKSSRFDVLLSGSLLSNRLKKQSFRNLLKFSISGLNGGGNHKKISPIQPLLPGFINNKNVGFRPYTNRNQNKYNNVNSLVNRRSIYLKFLSDKKNFNFYIENKNVRFVSRKLFSTYVFLKHGFYNRYLSKICTHSNIY